jgi:hypothetical protein
VTDSHATGSRAAIRREWNIGGPDSFICIGYRNTANYSPRTPTHRHFWFNVGPAGFSWERPKWNR